MELFALNLMKAGTHFLENPTERPFIPSWNRVNSALPGLMDELLVGVDEDMKDFS